MIFHGVLSEIVKWSVLDFSVFFANCFDAVLGFVSFEWLWKQLHHVLELSQGHPIAPIAQMLKVMWRTYAQELIRLLSAAQNIPCDLLLSNLANSTRMNSILKHGLPMPVRNGSVDKDYLAIHECVESKFNNLLKRARDVLKRKNIKI